MNLKAITLALLLAIFSSTVSLANAEVGEMIIFVKPVKEEFFSDGLILIIGTIKDGEGKHVQGVNIQGIFPNQVINSITDDFGAFHLKVTKPPKPDQYTVSVIASKPGYDITSETITFSVIERPQTPNDLLNQVQTALQTIPTLIEDGITKNPVSQLILRQMGEAKKQQEMEEQRQKEILQKNSFIDEQRKQAQTSLQDDLKSLEKEIEFYSPRNAFGRFVADFDSAVQSIFWGQFALTEQISKEAHEAKLNAIKEGKSSQEAMKIFQRKAAISHRQLIDYNSNLNVQYGLANNNTQNQFNVDGRFSRDQ